MHGWIAWIIIGIIAGAIARFVVPGEVGGGILMDMVVGLIGAVIGGFIMSSIFGNANGANGGFIWSIIVSVIGAVVLLFLVRLFTGRRVTTTV